ncbi:hypothetical protein PVAP13_8KG365802 [Panicum virgatum]|uniref:Uncharacterized protein n=1 Tax=Panicum virgatum TaxID=38727 RepID=A0A8T0PN59_PANVG|nr:hypothetical protein PVAP13_8KG365802 [Panicum virgatum]
MRGAHRFHADCAGSQGRGGAVPRGREAGAVAARRQRTGGCAASATARARRRQLGARSGGDSLGHLHVDDAEPWLSARGASSSYELLSVACFFNFFIQSVGAGDVATHL